MFIAWTLLNLKPVFHLATVSFFSLFVSVAPIQEQADYISH